MSALRVTRVQRRLMQKLADRGDRVTHADRLFYERRPDRQYRIRLTSQAKIARPMTIPPGCRWFTATRNIVRGYRLCLFVPNLEGGETDLDETTAREVFDWVAKPHRDVEARLRKAVGKRP